MDEGKDDGKDEGKDEETGPEVRDGFIKLVSGDGFSFVVEEEYAKVSGVIQRMMTNSFKESRTKVIHLPEFSGGVLEKICQYFYYMARFKSRERQQMLSAARGASEGSHAASLDSFADNFHVPQDMGKELMLYMHPDADLQAFNFPTETAPECDQETRLPSPQSNADAKRGISKHRLKSRSQNRTKARSKSSSRSLQTGTPLRENECSESIDSDLKDLEARLDAVEERAAQTLNSLRTSMAMCADHMVETMSAIIANGADNVRSSMTQVQTVRQGNRSTNGQLRALGQIDHE